MKFHEVLTIISEIAGITGVIYGFKKTSILNKPYIRIVIIFLVIAGLFFLVPWTRFSFKPETPLVVHDTIRLPINTISPTLPSYKKADTPRAKVSRLLQSKTPLNSSLTKTKQIPISPDTNTIKNDPASQHIEFKAPISNSPMQFGNGNTQTNILANPERHFTPDFFSEITKRNVNNSPIEIDYYTNTMETVHFANEIMEKLKEKGIAVQPFPITSLLPGNFPKDCDYKFLNTNRGLCIVVYPQIQNSYK